MFDEAEILVAGEMTNVCGVAGDQIVDGDNAMALGQQSIRKMRAEEACTSRDDGDTFGI